MKPAVTTNKIASVTKRDSATSLLRKIGINKADYHKFITRAIDKDNTECFKVDLGLAEKFLVASTHVDAVKPKLATASIKTPPADKSAIAHQLAQMTALAKDRVEAIDKKKALKIKAEKPAKKASRQTVIFGLINAGKTNEQIFEHLVNSEAFPAKNKSWIGWYRANMKPGKRFAHKAA